MLRAFLPCCCAPEEDEEILFSHHGKGISSSDDPFHRRERSDAEVAVEAARAQEWCLENLEKMEAPPEEADSRRLSRKQRKQQDLEERRRRQRADAELDRGDAELEPMGLPQESWAPPNTQLELALEKEIGEHVPRMTTTPTRKLVDAARRSPGLPPLLAAAQTIAERAPCEASALISSGCVEWLRDVLNRPDALESAAATHRLCFALHTLLDHVHPSAATSLPSTLLANETHRAARAAQGTQSLSRVLCAAIQRHRTFAPLVEAACLCLAAIGTHAGRAGASALVASGSVDAVLMAMEAFPEIIDVQAAGAAAIGALLSTDHPRGVPGGDGAADGAADGGHDEHEEAHGLRRVAEKALDAGALLSLSNVIQKHPERTSCVDAALHGLLGLLETLAPTFESLWPPVELRRERGHALAASGESKGAASSSGPALLVSVSDLPRPSAAQTRAARHATKTAVPLLCAALLLSTDHKISAADSRGFLAAAGDRDRAVIVTRACVALRLVAACTRLGAVSPASKLLPLCDRAGSSIAAAAAAAAAVRHEPRAARAACEVWALLPPAMDTQGAALRALLTAATALAAAAGVVQRDRDDFEIRNASAVRVSGRADRDPLLPTSLGLPSPSHRPW